MHERVAVFELHEGVDPVPELLAGTGLRLLQRPELTQLVRWLDTFDWRLWEKELTLQWASTSAVGEEAGTLTLRTGEGVAQYSLGPVEIPARAGDLPPSPFRLQIERLTYPRRLFPRASCRMNRQNWNVVDAEAKTVCRLERWSGVALDGGGGEARLPVVLRVSEVLGYPEIYLRVVRGLVERLPIPRGLDSSEVEVVFRTAGVNPGSYSSRLRVDLLPEMPTLEAARTICRVLLETLRINREGVLEDWDIEFLHDFRVAVRRTRSLLGQFKDVFPLNSLAEFRTEFGWLGRETGPLRDLDVYVEQVRRHEETLVADLPGLEGLLPYLEGSRKRELRSLRRVLRSARFRRLLEAWETYIDRLPGPVPPPAERPILATASARIDKTYRRILKKGRKLGDSAPPAELHQLRIECKKLRYLLEFFRSLYPDTEIRKSVKALKGLQDCLGNFNDLEVQQDRLNEYAAERMNQGDRDPAVYLAVGRFVERLFVLQQKEVESFRNRFAEFASARTASRFERLFAADRKGLEE